MDGERQEVEEGSEIGAEGVVVEVRSLFSPRTRSFLTIDPSFYVSQVDSRAAVARQEVGAGSRAGELADEVVEGAHSEVEEAEEAIKVCFFHFGPFLFACIAFG